MLKNLVGLILDTVWSKNTQFRFGRYLLSKCNSDNNGDPTTNGEYRLIDDLSLGILKRGGVIFDVGANVGDWTTVVVSQVQASVDVCAFEPAEDTFIELERNVDCLGKSEGTIKCFNLALGDRKSTAMLHKGTGFAGTNSLLKPSHNKDKIIVTSIESVTVECGQDFCLRNQIFYIDFMKIDTEGYEVPVLRGFENYLKEGKIGAIQFEYGGSWIDSRSYLLDVFELFSKYNYVLGKVYPQGIRWFERYDQSLESFCYSNYIAVKQELVASFTETT